MAGQGSPQYQHPTAPIAELVASRQSEKAAEKKNYRLAISATLWSFVATALFGLGIILPLKGSRGCVDFFTAFLVEKSLSIDNLFVFLMVFEYFQVPEAYTQRVLTWGILSALVLRGIMIAAGVMVINRFRPVLLFFSLILVVSAIKMLLPEDEHADLAQNPLVKLCRSMFDSVDFYDEDKFITTVDGVRKATPLLMVLLVVELSDVMFAIDSIPAVVGVTSDPLIVYTSNIFALMALRSLYTVLSKSVTQLCYLKHAVAAILLFIGGKMSLEYFHFHMPMWLSPVIIMLCLITGSTASLLHLRKLHMETRSKAERLRNDPFELTNPWDVAAFAESAAIIVGNALV